MAAGGNPESAATNDTAAADIDWDLQIDDIGDSAEVDDATAGWDLTLESSSQALGSAGPGVAFEAAEEDVMVQALMAGGDARAMCVASPSIAASAKTGILSDKFIVCTSMLEQSD